MRKKVLFDYAERFTERGDYYYKKLVAALKPIFEEAEADNVKLREVSHAATLTCSMLEVEGIVLRDVSKFQAARLGPDAVGSGVVPPSAPWIHSPVKMPPFAPGSAGSGTPKK